MLRANLKTLYQKSSRHGGNMAGAFADGAILFPLIAALTIHAGMNGVYLLISAGLLYIFSGVFFKVPMPVQPLKSIVVGGLALGASSEEIRIAGFGIGLFCLLMSLLPLERIEKYIPRHLIHGVQFSLGILLILKGVEWAWGDGSILSLSALLFLVPVAVLLQSLTAVPVLGVIALLGIVSGLWLSNAAIPSAAATPRTGIDAGIILALLLPQLALTLTNSVVGTYDTAQRYFGSQAFRVSLKNLLLSIGLGNVVMALGGGLPFCHGSGGMTAHVKAGARDYTMNYYIGAALVLLALVSLLLKVDAIPHYPAFLMAAMVSITGWYHIRLADKSWSSPDLRLIIIAMGATVLITHNMLYGLIAGMMFEAMRRRKRAELTP